MIKYLLPLIITYLKFFFVQFTSLPLPFLDPLWALALMYAFFHGLDTRSWVLYACYCGVAGELSRLGIFGPYLFSTILSCLAVSLLSRLFWRYDWILVIPAVFIGFFLGNHIQLFLTTSFFQQPGWAVHYGFFLGTTLLEALGTSALVFPLYFFSKKCAPELIA